MVYSVIDNYDQVSIAIQILEQEYCTILVEDLIPQLSFWFYVCWFNYTYAIYQYITTSIEQLMKVCMMTSYPQARKVLWALLAPTIDQFLCPCLLMSDQTVPVLGRYPNVKNCFLLLQQIPVIFCIKPETTAELLFHSNSFIEFILIW